MHRGNEETRYDDGVVGLDTGRAAHNEHESLLPLWPG